MRLPIVAALCALLLPAYVRAEPIGIEVLSQTYSTRVSTMLEVVPLVPGPSSYVFTIKTLTQPTPASDSIYYSELGLAFAMADLFSVSTRAEAWGSGPPRPGEQRVQAANALATTTLEFSPFADGPADITLIAGPMSNAIWTNGAVTLSNLTTGEVLFDVGWNTGVESTYGHIFHHSPFAIGPVEMPTALSSTDIYRLTMTTRIGAHLDGGHSTLAVSGLRVPEPTTITLAGLGLSLIALRRRPH